MRSAQSTSLAAVQQLSPEEIEFANYVHTRATLRFEHLKIELGHNRAVALEIEYQGADDLQLQSREALGQMNAILSALGRPVLLRWPAESRSTCDVCDADVPASQIKSGEYNAGEVGMSGPSCCRKCRGTEEVEDSDWSPVDEALGLPIFQADDFFYFHLKNSRDALQLCENYPCCDVVDLETERPMTNNQAAHRLEDSRYGDFERFGVAFPETLNVFLTNFFAGLYPALEAK